MTDLQSTGRIASTIRTVLCPSAVSASCKILRILLQLIKIVISVTIGYGTSAIFPASGPSEDGDIKPDRYSRRRAAAAAPEHDRPQPGEAGRGDRVELATGAQVRARYGPNQSKPAV